MKSICTRAIAPVWRAANEESPWWSKCNSISRRNIRPVLFFFFFFSQFFLIWSQSICIFSGTIPKGRLYEWRRGRQPGNRAIFLYAGYPPLATLAYDYLCTFIPSLCFFHFPPSLKEREKLKINKETLSYVAVTYIVYHFMIYSISSRGQGRSIESDTSPLRRFRSKWLKRCHLSRRLLTTFS